MELIEEYNETATLEMLQKMFYVDNDPFLLRDKISFYEIYDILSRSNAIYPSTKGADVYWTHFPMHKAQNMSYEVYDNYMKEMNKAYDNRDYFHFVFNQNKATERMIINVTNQDSSLKLSQALLSLQIQAPLTGNYQIPTFKVYLRKRITGTPLLKNDKIVIYYEQSHRDEVYRNVVDAAELCEVGPTDFSPVISGFYHLAANDATATYPVGIAVEKNPKISFTESCANTILQQLTGVMIDLQRGDASAQKKVKYKITNTSLKAETLFDTVKGNCCKPFNNR